MCNSYVKMRYSVIFKNIYSVAYSPGRIINNYELHGKDFQHGEITVQHLTGNSSMHYKEQPLYHTGDNKRHQRAQKRQRMHLYWVSCSIFNNQDIH